MWPSLEVATRIFDAFSIALAIGACVVFVATAVIVWMGIIKEHHWDELREQARLRIASLETETARANAEVAKAHEKTAQLAADAEASRAAIAEADARAAEANRKAEEEKLARLKIEERLAPRTLSDQQFAAIVKKTKEFPAGQEYRITTFWDLPEPLALANRIHQALQASGWKYLEHKTFTALLGGMAGVHVYVHPQSAIPTNIAARVLVAALTENGVAAELRDEDDPNNPNNIIKINVGTKP